MVKKLPTNVLIFIYIYFFFYPTYRFIISDCAVVLEDKTNTVQSEIIRKRSRKAWHIWGDISLFSPLFILLSAVSFFYIPVILFLPLSVFYRIGKKQAEVEISESGSPARLDTFGIMFCENSVYVYLYVICNVLCFEFL